MKSRLPNLNALRAFEAAARHGGMIRAADELCVTHGAVSRQVRGLEADLGVTLFAGPKSRLRLTPEGERLAAVLGDAFARIADGVSAVTRQARQDISVTCYGSFAMRWLMPRLPRFQMAHPDLSVRLAATTIDGILPNGPVDVMIGATDSARQRTRGSRLLFPEMAGPVLSPTLAERWPLPHPHALRNAPLLHSATRPAAWPEWLAEHGLEAPADPGSRFEHFYFMLEAALSGLGIAIGFWHLAADDVTAGRLTAPFGFTPTGRAYMAQPGQNAKPAATAFCDWLEKEAQAFMADRPCPQQAL